MDGFSCGRRWSSDGQGEESTNLLFWRGELREIIFNYDGKWIDGKWTDVKGV